MARIFGCHIEQTVLFATLRPMEMAGTLTLARKPLPQRFRILKLDGKVDLSWNISRLVVIALKKARLELFLVNIKTLVENELAGANCSALANDEDASGGDGLLAIETDDIYIDTGGKNDLLTIVQTPDDLKRRLTRAARSKSSASAASVISEVSSSTTSLRWPDKKRSTRLTFLA